MNYINYRKGKKNPYSARVKVDGRLYSLGVYPTEGQAALTVAEFMDDWHGSGMWWVYRETRTSYIEYRSYEAMKSRCNNINNPRYEDWGGRGISVCDRWSKSFYAFLADVGYKPTLDHSIDRIDNEGNYEPLNCKWSTRSEQQQNKRPYRRRKGRI